MILRIFLIIISHKKLILRVSDKLFLAYYKFCVKSKKRTGEPIFIFGNQKSGTTAIANLLALASLQSLSFDPKWLYGEVLKELRDSRVSLSAIISNLKTNEMEVKIIKEPSFGLIFKQLEILYPEAQFIQIVRHPIDNINSILLRCMIPGNQENFDKRKSKLSPEWNNIVFNDWLGYDYENHIQSLAKRWIHFYDVYKKNKDKILLIRYEDFLQNKAHYIYNVAKKINLPVKKNIDSFVDINFQPSRNKLLKEQFSLNNKNIELVTQICSVAMKDLRYEINLSAGNQPHNEY